MSKNNKKNTQLNETQKQELTGYAEQVNLLQIEIVANDKIAIRHGKKSLELAIKAGDFLRKAKKIAGHGNWGKWVAENVSSISKKTVENYMKLALEAAVVEERKRNNPNAKITSFLDEAKSLREAYIGVGIIKPTTRIKEGDEVMTPERMKKEQAEKYNNRLHECRQNMATRICNEIKGATVNWDLSTWSVKSDNPCSGDGPNWGARLFHDLASFISLRNNSSLTAEDEVYNKARIVLSEIVKTILLANRPTYTDVVPPDLSVVVPEFSMEFNTSPAEPTEVVAA